LLEKFRRNHFFNSILLLPYTILLRIFSFSHSEQWSGVDNGFLSSEYLEWSTSPFYENILAILLVFVQGVLINRIVIINRLSNGIHLFAGLFYILIVSMIPAGQYLSPVLLANTFFILGLTDLFYAYKRAETSGKIFNAGFWIGFSAMFYSPYIIFTLFGLIGLSVLRVFKVKEAFQFLIGILSILFLVSVYGYWTYSDLSFFGNYFENFGFVHFVMDGNYFNYGKLVLFGFLITMAIFSYNRNTIRKSIQARKKIDVLYWMMLFSGISMVFFSNLNIYHLEVVSIPLAIFLGFQAFNMKSRPMAELLHLTLFSIALAIQIVPYFIK